MYGVTPSSQAPPQIPPRLTIVLTQVTTTLDQSCMTLEDSVKRPKQNLEHTRL